MNLITPLPGEGLLQLGKRCNAVYICPQDSFGFRKGPLVVYAGKDDQGRNLVGDIYFNFLKMAEHPKVVTAFAEAVCEKIRRQGLLSWFDTICGIPRGGKIFGEELARVTHKRFTSPEKTPKPTENGKKQEYIWDVSGCHFEFGERVAVVEDVFNNFQNTDNTLAEIALTGAGIVLLVGALNRSPVYDTTYTPKSGPFVGCNIPVIASIREAYPEYAQDDPAVADDVAQGNIEFEVKENWARLMAAMER